MKEEEKRRRIECNKYPECLDQAAKANNLRFTCKGCESYAWNDPMDKEKRLMKEEAVVIGEQEKFCTKCKVSKPLEAFNHGLGKHGKRSWCRTCDTEYAMDYKARKSAGKVKPRKAEVRRRVAKEEVGNAKHFLPASFPQKDRATVLADEHWDYIRSVLELHGREDLEEIGFHYKSAMIHGYKHGVADKE